MADGVDRPQDIEPLAARGAAHQEPHEAPEVAQECPVDEVGRVDEADHAAESLGLPQPGPQLLVEELGLLSGVGLGRDHPQLAEPQAHPLEEPTDLRRPAADAGPLLDHGSGLARRTGRVLAEVVLEALAVVIQVAGGPGPVGPLESLDTALLVLPQVGSEGVLGDPGQAADLLVGQPLALEVDGLHLELHPRVGVVEPLVVEGVDVLRGEVDGDHRRRPDWGSIDDRLGGELTSDLPSGQHASFSREEYNNGGLQPRGTRV